MRTHQKAISKQSQEICLLEQVLLRILPGPLAKLAPTTSICRTFAFRNTYKIVFVTGTRADFGKLEPLIIRADCGLDVSIFSSLECTYLDDYGLTKIEVRRLEGVSFFEFNNEAASES